RDADADGQRLCARGSSRPGGHGHPARGPGGSASDAGRAVPRRPSAAGASPGGGPEPAPPRGRTDEPEGPPGAGDRARGPGPGAGATHGRKQRMNMLEVRDLARRYGKIEAVKGVSFDVEEGEIFGFLGPNG